MAYAIFCGDSKISRSFETRTEVWDHASESGLVIDLPVSEEAEHPKQVLSNDYEICSCEADPMEKNELIQRHRVSGRR